MIDDRTLAKVAELFYIYDISQLEIAKKFNFSKGKVCRLISEAKRRKIIDFSIKKFDTRILELERELEKNYNLNEAIIYYNSDLKDHDEEIIFQELGELGVKYLERVIKDNLNIALTWGKTIYGFIDKIKDEKKYKLNIFSTLGGVNLITPESQSNYLAQMMSSKIGGTLYPIYLPLILEKPVHKKSLNQVSNVIKVLGNSSEIDYYFTSVGSVTEKSRLYTSHGFGIDFLKKLNAKGIVGEFGLHFFDKDGNFIQSGIEDRVINLPIEEIKKIKTRIAIVFGKDKIIAARGFLKTGICDVFITDSMTAEAILGR
jgi:DNA-binding transcriptional regulator LsrR (DeoR family)